jgi:hypothetical protein
LAKYTIGFNAENYLDFELESFANSAIWLAKKKYVQNILWKDPKSYENLSYISSKGVEIVQSSTPEFSRIKLKELIKYIFSYDELNMEDFVKLLRKIKTEFKVSNIETLTNNYKINNYQKYILNDQDKFEIASGCPMQVRAAGYHNYLIHKNGLRNKYSLLKNGDKIKMYISQDPDCNVFAFGGGNYPYEIAPKIDYEAQFEKVLIDPINRFILAMNKSPLDRNLIINSILF